MIPTWEGASNLPAKLERPLIATAYPIIYPTFATLVHSNSKAILFRLIGSFSSIAIMTNGGEEYIGHIYAVTADTKELFYCYNIGQYGGDLTLDQFTKVTFFDAFDVLRVRNDYRSNKYYYTVDAVNSSGVEAGYYGQYNTWTLKVTPQFCYDGSDFLGVEDSLAKLNIHSPAKQGRLAGYCIPNKMTLIVPGFVATRSASIWYETANVWGKSLRVNSGSIEIHIYLWDGTTLHKTAIDKGVYARRVAVSNELCLITYTDNTYYLYRYNAVSHEFEKDPAFNPSDDTLPNNHNYLGICEDANKAICFDGAVPNVISLTNGAVTVLPSIADFYIPNNYTIQMGVGKPNFLYIAKNIASVTSYVVLNLNTNAMTTHSPDLSSKISKLDWLSMGTGNSIDYLYIYRVLTMSSKVYAIIKAKTVWGSVYNAGFIIYEPDPDTGELIEYADTLDGTILPLGISVYNQQAMVDKDILLYYENDTQATVTDFSGEGPFQGQSVYSSIEERFLFSLKGPDGKRVSFVNKTVASAEMYIISKFTKGSLPKFSTVIQSASSEGYYIFLVQGYDSRYLIVFSKGLYHHLAICQNTGFSHSMKEQFNSMKLFDTIEYAEKDHVPFGFRELPEAASVTVHDNDGYATVGLTSGRILRLCLEDFLV